MIESVQFDALKIFDPREDDVDEFVEKLIHPLTAKGDLDADGVTSPEFESGNGFFGDGGLGFLTRNECQLLGDVFKCLVLVLIFGNSDVENDFIDSGDGKIISEFEFAPDFRQEFILE
jgi:hypothetical protein